MSNKSKDKFEGWGWLGAIIGGIYGYALNENGGEAFGYAIAGYFTGRLVGFVIHTFLAWLIITFILIVSLSVLQTRLKWFQSKSTGHEMIHGSFRQANMDNTLNQYRIIRFCIGNGHTV